MTLPAPLHDDLWRCESCGVIEDTRHVLCCFTAWCRDCLPEGDHCVPCGDVCGSRRQGEAETGGRAA